MDTNTIAALVQALQQHNPGPAGTGNNVTIIILIIAALTGVLASVASWIKAKAVHVETLGNREIATKAAEAAKIVADKTAENVQKIEISVNSNWTKMEERVVAQTKQIEDLNKRIEELSNSLVKLQQKTVDAEKNQSVAKQDT